MRSSSRVRNTFNPSRNPAVGADQEHGLTNLLDGAAIIDRTVEMSPQLRHATHAGQHGNDEQAAELWLQRPPGPRSVEAHLVGHIAKRAIEIVGAGKAAVKVIVAQSVTLNRATLFGAVSHAVCSCCFPTPNWVPAQPSKILMRWPKS